MLENPYKMHLHKFGLTPGNQATIVEVVRVESNGAMREVLSLYKHRNPIVQLLTELWLIFCYNLGTELKLAKSVFMYLMKIFIHYI